MKKIFTLLLLALFVQASFAQEDEKEKPKRGEDINTIFTKENLKVTGGFISPELKVGNVYEDASMLVGGRIGMTFNDKFNLGMGGYGLVNNSNFEAIDYPGIDQARISMGYGGLTMEYVFFTNEKIHFTIPVLIGAGGVYIYEDVDDYFNNDWNELENSAAFIVEPGIYIEFNLFKFFRIDLGASYRLVRETDLVNLSDDDLSDFTINAGFKFGFF
ncbi:MAG: porin family protein [Bacteroidetes bacterium]|nr:porin family protein [Bacteroidota bacterium]